MATDNGAFPELTIDVGQSAQYNTSRPISTLEQTVEGTLREVLAWRPRTTDPKGFLAALKQAFTEKEVDGHTTWTWTPRSYSVQADMGAVTGAQASIYARARAALDQSVPLIEGLHPLRADADDEDMEAIRALVKSQLTELINELGVVGGPRPARINGLFDVLLGADFDDDDPDHAGGLLGLMRDHFGLERRRVNKIEEEQNLTDFRIVVEHVIGLQRNWETVEPYFDPLATDVFLGTQLVLLSRSLGVIAESVQELYFKMDSVWLGAAERQTVLLNSGLTIAGLLSWVERFASEEAPHIIRDAGKDGVIAFQPTLERLYELVAKASEESKGSGNNPQAGFHHGRVQEGLEGLKLHLGEAVRLASQVRRDPLPEITDIKPQSVPAKDDCQVLINGRYFQEGATVLLYKKPVKKPIVSRRQDRHSLIETERKRESAKDVEDPIDANHVIVFNATYLMAFFNLENAGTYYVVVHNPDGGENERSDASTIEVVGSVVVETLAHMPFQVDKVDVITNSGATLNEDNEVNVSEYVKGISITFNRPPSLNSIVAMSTLDGDDISFNFLVRTKNLWSSRWEYLPGAVEQGEKEVEVKWFANLDLIEDGNDGLPAGQYRVELFGDESGERQAIISNNVDKVPLDNYTSTFKIVDTSNEEAA